MKRTKLLISFIAAAGLGIGLGGSLVPASSQSLPTISTDTISVPTLPTDTTVSTPSLPSTSLPTSTPSLPGTQSQPPSDSTPTQSSPSESSPTQTSEAPQPSRVWFDIETSTLTVCDDAGESCPAVKRIGW